MNTLEKMAFIKSASIFKNVEDDVMLVVAASMEEQIAKPNELIIEKGSLGTYMYIIVNGKVKVHDGDRTITELSDRQVFGELAALSPEQRTASITALEESLFLKINQVTIYDLIEKEQGLAQGIIELLCQKLRFIQTELNNKIMS